MDFTLLSWQCAVVCAAYFVAGMIDAVCGGGGLITVPVLMALGAPVHYITGTNQCSVVVGAATSLYKYKRSNSMYLKYGIIAAILAIFGGILGAKLNMYVPERYLEIIMIVLMPLMALLLFLKKDFGEADRSDTLSARKILLLSCLIGLFGGAYQGFYGPGSGTVFMIAFALFMKFDLVKASGTSKIPLLFAAVGSSVTYALSGLVLWRIAIVAMVFYILGSYLGASLAVKNGTKIIRPFLFFVIGLLLLTLLVK